HVKSAVARARTLMPEVRATAFAPLAVRALLLSGTLEARAGDVEGGIDILYQAARAASATHDDVAYARALTELIRPVGVLRGRVGEAARIIGLAEGAVERLGYQPDLLSLLFRQKGIYYRTARHQPLAAMAQLQLALAIAQTRQPNSVDVGLTLSSIG